MMREDGWKLERQKGSHRQYRHPVKSGTVTLAGDLNQELKPKTLASILRHASLKGCRT
ncbi:MAG: type II toxin-antitoxin system HicA family toxin [Gaiellaceae bacterium]